MYYFNHRSDRKAALKRRLYLTQLEGRDAPAGLTGLLNAPIEDVGNLVQNVSAVVSTTLVNTTTNTPAASPVSQVVPNSTPNANAQSPIGTTTPTTPAATPVASQPATSSPASTPTPMGGTGTAPFAGPTSPTTAGNNTGSTGTPAIGPADANTAATPGATTASPPSPAGPTVASTEAPPATSPTPEPVFATAPVPPVGGGAPTQLAGGTNANDFGPFAGVAPTSNPPLATPADRPEFDTTGNNIERAATGTFDPTSGLLVPQENNDLRFVRRSGTAEEGGTATNNPNAVPDQNDNQNSKPVTPQPNTPADQTPARNTSPQTNGNGGGDAGAIPNTPATPQIVAVTNPIVRFLRTTSGQVILGTTLVATAIGAYAATRWQRIRERLGRKPTLNV